MRSLHLAVQSNLAVPMAIDTGHPDLTAAFGDEFAIGGDNIGQVADAAHAAVWNKTSSAFPAGYFETAQEIAACSAFSAAIACNIPPRRTCIFGAARASINREGS